MVQDEFPVDGGLTSRRIDILSHHASSQDWLIIELKRAEAMSRYAAKSAVTKYCKIPLTVRLRGIAQKVSAVICLKAVIGAERSKRWLGAQLKDAAARTFWQ